MEHASILLQSVRLTTSPKPSEGNLFNYTVYAMVNVKIKHIYVIKQLRFGGDINQISTYYNKISLI